MKITKSDKSLALIGLLSVSVVLYNIFGGAFADIIRELIKHVF